MYSSCLTPVSLAGMDSIMHNVPFENRNTSCSFAICPLILLSCLIVLVGALSTMLEQSGDSGHPCLISDFNGIA